MLPKRKKMNLKDPHHKNSVPLAMGTNLPPKSSKLEKKKTKKRIPGQMLSQDRPEKNPATCLVLSGEMPNPRQTSIEKNNDCVMTVERGALVRDSDPPSGRSVQETAGATWRARASRLIQNIWPLVCRT